MTDTLKSALLAPERRNAVVNDLSLLVDAEVAEKSGASGLAVKGGYAVLKKISARFVPDAIDSMLDGFVDRMDPYYSDFTASSEDSLGGYLAARSSEVSDALLGVTDERANGSRREAVKKVYGKLRPQAQKHVEAALPSLGDVIQRHTS